jgi:hypothetical protein
VIKIGEPLHFEVSKNGKLEASHLQHVADNIMLKIAELTGETYSFPAVKANV